MERKCIGEISQEKIDSLSLIITKISCAKQALRITPDGTDEDKKLFTQSVLDSIGTYEWLQKEWWEEIGRELGTNRASLYLDFSTGKVYRDE